MLVKALTSFAGKVSMYAGEIREVAEETVAEDLIKAGYAVKYEADKKGAKTVKEEVTPKSVETPVEVPELPENPVEASEEAAEEEVKKTTSKKSK